MLFNDAENAWLCVMKTQQRIVVADCMLWWQLVCHY